MTVCSTPSAVPPRTFGTPPLHWVPGRGTVVVLGGRRSFVAVASCRRSTPEVGAVGLPHRRRRDLPPVLPDVPRSYREAQLAQQLMAFGHGRAAVTSFDDLGVFQILAEAQDPNTVQRFVRKWLGALLDYDDSRSAELVATLSTYLEAGGNYAHSARALTVHRNTLRYRLKRIGEISGHDLGEPDVQFNLQLATRAWRTLTATRGSSLTAEPVSPIVRIPLLSVDQR